MQFEIASQDEGNLSVPSLPKGGGAIRSLGETFRANPATGTASLTVPLPFSPARALTPAHRLSYDSGAGNGPFGQGWSVDIPHIARKTSRALPTYDDLTDAFLMGDAELVPVLEDGAPVEREAQEDGRAYSIRHYRPRIEAGFDRIELWRDTQNGQSHWRIWSSGNTASIFGQTAGARINDPADPTRVFSWHLERIYDGFGNLTAYRYRREDDAGITPGDPHDGPRLGQPQSQLYPWQILYGNRTPFRGLSPPDDDFCFRTTFDYGETPPLSPRDTPGDWTLRPDPFSRYRPGFEIRTRRLCTRVVTEHLFPELGDDLECVRSLELTYDQGSTGQSRIRAIQLAGYTRTTQSAPFTVETLPALKLSYSEARIDTTPRRITDIGGETVTTDTTGRDRWIDLFGDALPGLLTETGGALSYRENLGAGVLGDPRSLQQQPSLSGLEAGLTVEDRHGRGAKQIVARTMQLAGLYQTGHDDLPGGIAPFRGFRSMPTIPDDANLRALDVTGDGLSDLVRTDGEYLIWYRATEDGDFDQSQRVALPANDNGGPAFLFSDRQGLTFLADMSGDGLLDIVQVSARRVRYWPNCGYGRFGPAVDMSAPPSLGPEGDLDPAHIRLTDVTGSGLTDILWIGGGRVTLWINQNGNGFAPPRHLDGCLPDGIPANDVTVSDLLGQGTACLCWTGRMSDVSRGQRLYVDLYGGVKPDLLQRVENGFGGSTELTYRPSTAFARDAEAAGQPWATRLHFPVHCLAVTKVSDAVTGYSLTSSYAYHHGYYDPDDREFRGFARVDQYDTETVVDTAATGAIRAFTQPTTLTRSWFHTGARFGQRSLETALAKEFYAHDRLPLTPLDPELPDSLSDRDWTEAQRTLKGGLLRSETYALDESDAAEHPYTITMGQTRLVLHQPGQRLGERDVPPVFQTLNRQSVSFVLDRNPDDPRVSQEIVLDWDDHGTPISGITLSHGRWAASDHDTPEDIEALQRQAVALWGEQSLIDRIDPTIPVPPSLLGGPRRSAAVGYAATSAELRGLTLPHWTLATVADLIAQRAALPELAATDHVTPTGRRLIAASRSYFAADTLTEALPLGQIGPTGLIHHSERQAFTADSVTAIYDDKVSDQMLRDARYVQDAATQDWWVASGTTHYGDTPDTRFYLPEGNRDPFGNESHVSYDRHHLMMVDARDALENTTRLVPDYRHLTPTLIRDANDNWSAVRLNALGQPVAVAAMGKVAGVATPTGYEPCEGSTLDRPTASFAYDLTAWQEGRGPARVTKTAYTTHASATADLRETLISHDYTDGMGHLVMTKVQQAPGPAQQIGPDGTVEPVDTSLQDPKALRWLGNGRTVLNNKGQPLRQFEPYFSTTPDFENAAALVEQGFSVLPLYDSAGRQIGQLSPDGSWTKVRHSPWRQETWDAADTCDLDPLADDDLRGHFQGLPTDLYAASWVDRRAADARGLEASRAAALSRQHAGTPAVSHLDATGRPVLAVVDNAPRGTVQSRTMLDVEGNALSVHDDLDRAVVTSRFNLLPPPDRDTPKPPLWQSSMDQGVTLSFFDAMGRPAVSWDAHGRSMRTVYDALSRPVETWQTQLDGAEHRISLTLYGESAPDAAALNLKGTAWQVFDTGGWTETGANDFQGNPLTGRSRLLDGADPAPHWPDAAADREQMLEPETFRTETSYDALGRPTRTALPYSGETPGNIEHPGYDEGGALAHVDVEIAGAPAKRYVEEITYDAKGQRQSIRYGNGARTSYAYDPETYRLTRLHTTGPGGAALQDLSYTYDILGNVVAIRDATQPVIYHAGAMVEPVARYTYDALSRLVEATGREHIAQTGAPDWQAGAGTAGNVNDLTQMRPYTQSYDYDSLGNIQWMRQQAQGNSWTRYYGYDTASNRLIWTNVGTNGPAGGDSYSYNAAGTMVSMPHLGLLTLTATEQIAQVDLGGGGRAVYTYGAGGDRRRKRIERTGVQVEERIYLGGIEVYRKWVGGALKLQRETVHIADDRGAIALVETQTHDDTGAIAPPDRVERYQLSNHLGSATLELDDAGAILTREEYHPYGTTAFYAATAGRALPPKRYRYTGQERDEETGLQCHGVRHYAPWLARWTAADPIGIGDGLNVYAYVGGRPVGSIDASGTIEDEVLNFHDPSTVTSDTHSRLREQAPAMFSGAWSGFVEYGRGMLDPKSLAGMAVMMGETMPSTKILHSTILTEENLTSIYAKQQELVGFDHVLAGAEAHSKEHYEASRAVLGDGADILYGGGMVFAFGLDVLAPGPGELGATGRAGLKGKKLLQGVVEEAAETTQSGGAARVTSVLEENLDLYKAIDVDGASATERLFFRTADDAHSYFGLTRIADDPDVLRLWQQAIAKKMDDHMFYRGSGVANGGNGNAVGRFITALADDAPIDGPMATAAYKSVRTEFGKLFKEAYPNRKLGEVEHILNKAQYPRLALDPSNLIPTGTRTVHWYLHLVKSSGANEWFRVWSTVSPRFRPPTP